MAFLLPHLLAEAATRAPGRTAVVDRDRALTYAELDQASSRLAGVLRELGLCRGDRIGLYLPKSLEAVVGLLSILKAGGAYVPLDLRAPTKRVGFIIRNCGIRGLISRAAKLEELAGSCPGLELEWAITADEPPLGGKGVFPEARFISWADAEKAPVPSWEAEGVDRDLAYILYTSGSTGAPKGVMITHLNALTFVNWSAREFKLQPADRVSNHAPLHFDLSIFDLFSSLKAGATVFLVPEELSVFPRSLIRFIRERRISVWYSVPSILVHLLVHGNLSRYSFPDLRLILFAGEVFPPKYLRELMEIVPQAAYYNLYGPTETNVCTFYQVREVEPGRSKPVPIGRACPNTEIYLADEQGRLVMEAGQVGEILVRGSGVAQGYWGDPEKTASRFRADFPLSPWAEPAYRTGDLATRDGDGTYHLLGRKDQQIKSRGYRIELGEIEAVLYSHPAVKAAAAIAQPDEFITNRLKAFIVPSAPVGRKEVEKFLAERLPPYMIPEIEFREALPTTSTGKVDRLWLAAPNQPAERIPPASPPPQGEGLTK